MKPIPVTITHTIYETDFGPWHVWGHSLMTVQASLQHWRTEEETLQDLYRCIDRIDGRIPLEFFRSERFVPYPEHF